MPPDSPGAPALIGLDWGTSSLRVMLLDAAGRLIESHDSDRGIRRAGGAFADICAELVAPWRSQHADLPLYASGMITSRNGWVETPYLPLPADARALARALVRRKLPDGGTIAFVPGLRDESGPYPDVMRGEETEIIGYLAQSPPADGDTPLLILPGTHTKWVRIEEGRIVRFRTLLTGELYGTLRQHSILGALIPAPEEVTPRDDESKPCESETKPCDTEAFARGIAMAGARGDNLLANLFSARSLVLCDRLAPERIADYLSGLLIGSEVAQMRSLARRNGEPDTRACTIIGRGNLAARYAQACEAHGMTARIAPPGAAGAGLAALHALADSGPD
jgi:2-dehydro-3-deoxygalactonokinase